jgi:hypothetical protein
MGCRDVSALIGDAPTPPRVRRADIPPPISDEGPGCQRLGASACRQCSCRGRFRSRRPPFRPSRPPFRSKAKSGRLRSGSGRLGPEYARRVLLLEERATGERQAPIDLIHERFGKEALITFDGLKTARRSPVVSAEAHRSLLRASSPPPSSWRGEGPESSEPLRTRYARVHWKSAAACVSPFACGENCDKGKVCTHDRADVCW